MMKHALVALALLAPTQASANPVTASTTCAAALAAWNSRETARMLPVALYIDAVMDGAEGTLMRQGQPARLRELSETARYSIMSLALGYCRRGYASTLRQAAVGAYLDWRDFREDFVGER